MGIATFEDTGQPLLLISGVLLRSVRPMHPKH
jgi:hypothetical protein